MAHLKSVDDLGRYHCSTMRGQNSMAANVLDANAGRHVSFS